MPTTPSAIKRLKQSIKRRMHNRITKIDKAGSRRVLHPNTAARRKSRLTREYHAALAKAKG